MSEPLWISVLPIDGMLFVDGRAPRVHTEDLPECCRRSAPEHGWLQFECPSCGAAWTTAAKRVMEGRA
jgi:predicted RNA-binding Zn-ribbon protein involved in translation (DUF1610 family)